MGGSVKNVTSSVSNIAKNPTSVKAWADGAVTQGSFGLVNGTDALGNMLLGQKNPGTPDSYVPLDPLQQKALDQYGKILDTNTDQLAQDAANSQLAGISRGAAFGENQARQGVMDTQRQAQDMVRQRGLGNSSVGLNAILSQNRGLANQIGDIRANANSQVEQINAGMPLNKYNMRLQNLGAASGGINDILNTRIFKQGQQGGGRTGGLAPLIGAGAGALLAPPGQQAAGAQLGVGLGQYATQMR
jgi:hypothetical protein